MNLDEFNMDMSKCPLDTPVMLYGQYMMFNVVFKGTLTLYEGNIIRGKCLDGNDDMFYRSGIFGWKEIE